MRDKIFIIWSGSNDIALKVKKILDMKNYKCTIGGNADNNSQFASVGDTVIQQIKSCNQAIVIFQNRTDGAVSNNLFFELGYVLAMYGQTKVHCVRKSNEQVVLPSDFDNSFVEPINAGDTDDDFVNGILKYFFDRQKMSVNANKMMLMNNRYKMHDYIQSHYSEQGSKCSDYELAQYILFYMQAGHMFGDEKKVYKEMKQFKDNYYTFFSDELSIAVNICISFFDMINNIQTDNKGNFYIDRATFRKFRDNYTEYRAEIVRDDIGTFDEWANVFTAEHFAYAYGLYASCPELPLETKLKNMEKSKVWAYQSLTDLKVLEISASVRDNNDHKGIVSLFYAYVYRNMHLACKELGETDEALQWLEKTKKERTSLKTTFEIGSIDSQLYDNFEMEYYLTLIEYLHNADKLGLDEEDVEDYKDEIKKYLQSTKKLVEHSKYVERIEYLFKELD